MKQREKKIVTAMGKAEEIASDLACMSGVSPEGRKAKLLGEKLHKLLVTIADALLA